MPGKHRGEPVTAKIKREKRKKQEAADVGFWVDSAEDSGVQPHDPADQRKITKRTRGKHRRG